MNQKILIVDDQEDIRNILGDRLRIYGYEILTASDGEEALRKTNEESPELVILDIQLPEIDGMEVLTKIMAEHPNTVVMMITAYATVQRAVEAMKLGAYDFIEKPFNADLVRIKVEKALEKQTLLRENKYLRSELKGEYGEIVGQSQKIIDILKIIEKVAPSDSTVLITGESGTGKELVARALHNNSQRVREPFVPINCSAIQPNLLESEIFGHEKGAFTGAIARKPGKMELANGGTLFLDEIGDMAMELQAKFLRAIQNKECERVGGIKPFKVDVRFIAATNQNLQKAIKEGKFREDLFYRLNVININIPPLREHKEDIPVLVKHFLRKHSISLKKPKIQINDEAIGIIMEHNWPGNIRELENCIERAILLADSDIIKPEDLPADLISPIMDSSNNTIKLGASIKDMEKDLILKTLEEFEGNRTQTAKILGISLRSLQYKLKEYMGE